MASLRAEHACHILLGFGKGLGYMGVSKNSEPILRKSSGLDYAEDVSGLPIYGNYHVEFQAGLFMPSF